LERLLDFVERARRLRLTSARLFRFFFAFFSFSLFSFFLSSFSFFFQPFSSRFSASARTGSFWLV